MLYSPFNLFHLFPIVEMIFEFDEKQVFTIYASLVFFT